MIYDHFQATRAYDAAQCSSDLFNICLQNDDVQEFDTRWDQILLGTSEIPQENIVEGLYKMEVAGSEQLQTVLSLYNQELNRDQRLSTMERQHIDQMIKTRHIRARNERFETVSIGQES